jgi:hypothetical protein
MVTHPPSVEELVVGLFGAIHDPILLFDVVAQSFHTHGFSFPDPLQNRLALPLLQIALAPTIPQTQSLSPLRFI